MTLDLWRGVAVMRRAMLAVVRGEPLPELTAEQWASLPALAASHGLAPRLAVRLSNNAAPDKIMAALRSDLMGAVAVNLRAQADLKILGPALDATGVPWVTVKGPVLADHWYQRSSQRSFCDLDVIVHPGGFRDVLAALDGLGAQLVDRNWSLALQQERAELSYDLPRHTALDLHWHVLNTPSLRRSFPLDIVAMLDRRRTVALQNGEVPTLDAEDTLLHLCLHTMLSGGQRLSWYVDIQQVVMSGKVDWTLLTERSHAAKAGVLVAVALRRTRVLTGADVPVGLEHRLAPRGRGWLVLAASVDALRPLGNAPDRRLSGQLLVEAARADTRTSAASLLGSLRRDLWQPLLHDPEHPWRHVARRGARAEDNPLWQAPIDPDDRAGYLNYVAAQGRR